MIPNWRHLVNNPKLTDKINAVLPQTQCTLCAYADCKSYAQAIANRSENIDKCHPGGISTLKKLAAITGTKTKQLEPKVTSQYKPPSIVTIEEERCIGWTKCIQACPVDAIMGSAKTMHSVIESECSGCDLCIPVCPVDCILPIQSTHSINNPELLKNRYEYKKTRILKQNSNSRNQHLKNKLMPNTYSTTTTENRQQAIAAAIARKNST